VVGGLLQTWSGWRAGFAACAVVGGCLFAVALRAHRETLAPARRVSIRPGYVLRSYAGLFLSWRFCAYALAYSSLNCTFIGFFVVGPSYLSQVFGMTPIGISLAMLATYLGFTAGNLLAVRHVKRAGIDRLLAWGLVFGFGGTLLLVAVASQPVLWWMLAAVAIQSFGTGLAFSTGIAGATSVDPARAGTASALTGAIQMVTAALIAVIAGALYDGTLVPFAWTSVALCACAGACIWPLWRRRAPVGVR
jgi:DHA1 family bicyclomycin/chloramphenicol resistance-like MFS transporter